MTDFLMIGIMLLFFASCFALINFFAALAKEE